MDDHDFAAKLLQDHFTATAVLIAPAMFLADAATRGRIR